MKKVITIHQTDLYRPHIDPDDHYDLACQYALAKQGYIDLRVVLIDYPPNEVNQPDTLAIEQLNNVTHLNIPTSIGGKKGDNQSHLMMTLRDILINSEEKVVIHIVGSCFDMANFYSLNKTLFIQKVEALYINAGSAFYTNNLEYNQLLNNESYLTLFSIPVRIYWLPCFHDMDKPWVIRENGSYYKFQQKELFKHLDKPVLNYFISCLRQDLITSDGIQLIQQEVDSTSVHRFGELYRNMWCTAGFIHSVGLSVDKEEIITDKTDEPVFSFKDINISILNGHLYWKYSNESSNIKILKINDTNLYQDKMTKALSTIISWL